MQLDDQIISLYIDGKGGTTIARELGISPGKVYVALRRHNVPRRSHREKSLRFSVNSNFFNVIDTEEKAYWLGFLAADGYLTSGRVVACSLSSKDQEHLEKLKAALQSTHKIKTYTQTTGYAPGTSYCRLLITDPELHAGLVRHGVTEQKTHSLIFPELDSTMIRHFIRGYIDGDGCWAKSTKSASGFTLKVCGTEAFLAVIAKHLGLSHERVHKHKNIYVLEKSGKDVLRLMDYVYLDATVCLERKRERWLIAQSLLGENPVE